MNWIITFLDGKKTYVAGLAGAVYGILIATNVTPSKASIWATITSVAIIGVRSAGSKLITAVAAGATPVFLHEGNDATISSEQDGTK
jgi:hypothetical protein